MEALACGTPVVTYDSGGAAEGLTPETGTAVGKDCVDALARETEHCATGHYSAKACRELAEKRFDMRRNLSGYFDLYAELHADKR
jgi:glycosyltransferase involved in cell wall biosynthesis